MKLFTLFVALHLSSFGLGISIPLASVQHLEEVDRIPNAVSHGEFKKRHPRIEHALQEEKKNVIESRATGAKPKRPKPSPTKSSKSNTKTPKPSATQAPKPKTSKPSKPKQTSAVDSCVDNTKGSGKEKASKDCAEPEGQFLQLGKGWRSPTKKEQAAAKVKTFVKGGEAPYTFAVTAPEYTGRLPDDCPTTYEGYLTVKIPEASGTGILVQPKPNQPLFYTAGPKRGAERDWSHKQGMGFRFLKDHFKTDQATQRWIYEHQNCPDFWGKASAAYASLVEDDVHVLLPSKMFNVGQKPVWPTIKREGQAERKAIWDSHEYPTILKDNKKACRIWRWVYASTTPELIAVRTGASAKAAGCPATYADKPSTKNNPTSPQVKRGHMDRHGETTYFPGTGSVGGEWEA